MGHHLNKRIPACGHKYRNKKCRLCMVYDGQQMRAYRAQGYAANKAGKPVTAWPRTGEPYSAEWYQCKNAWQDGWLAAEARPELPIKEWIRKHDPDWKAAQKTPKTRRKEHRIEDWMKEHDLKF
jgi:hypothetical protein